MIISENAGASAKILSRLRKGYGATSNIDIWEDSGMHRLMVDGIKLDVKWSPESVMLAQDRGEFEDEIVGRLGMYVIRQLTKRYLPQDLKDMPGFNPKVPNGDGGNVYDSREYFPLTNPDGSFINDPDISGYRNVPGLAVERHEGSIRTVLYGFLYGDATVSSKDGKDTTEVHDTHDTGSKIGKAPLSSVIDYLANRELAQGSIEFSNDTLTRSTTVFPTSQKSDPMNPMDFVPGSNQYMPGSDNFHIVNNLSQFHMLATTGSDGFYTYYTYPAIKKTRRAFFQSSHVLNKEVAIK